MPGEPPASGLADLHQLHSLHEVVDVGLVCEEAGVVSPSLNCSLVPRWSLTTELGLTLKTVYSVQYSTVQYSERTGPDLEDGPLTVGGGEANELEAGGSSSHDFYFHSCNC